MDRCQCIRADGGGRIGAMPIVMQFFQAIAVVLELSLLEKIGLFGFLRTEGMQPRMDLRGGTSGTSADVPRFGLRRQKNGVKFEDIGDFWQTYC